MGFTEWLGSLWKTESEGVIKTTDMVATSLSEVQIKSLAIQICVNIIAKSLACCEFLTFDKGKEVKGDIYYMLNVEPNQNQCAVKFWFDVVSKLVHDNQCIIYPSGDRLYLCDSFAKNAQGMRTNFYSDIYIRGEKLNKTLFEDDVIVLSLQNANIRTVISNLQSSYSDLITSLRKLAKRAGTQKLLLDVPTTYPQVPKAQEELNTLLGESFKALFDVDKNAVVSLTNGLQVKEILESKADKPISQIIELTEKTFEHTALAFGIPKKLLTGEVADTDEAVNNLITFTIKPLAEMITDELNRKLFGKTEYLKKSRLKLDTTRIKHVDITKIAGALDVLTRIGAYSINDSLKALGKEELQESWANERYITKNYEAAKLKKGEE